MKRSIIDSNALLSAESLALLSAKDTGQEFFGVQIKEATIPMPKGVIGIFGYPERPESAIWLKADNEERTPTR